MAWWGNSTPVTYADHVKQMDPEGNIMPMVELLEEMCPMVKDMIILEGNETNGHRGLVRRGLPAATWRKLNIGVSPTKSESAPVYDTTGNLEAYAEVDKDIADMNSNTAMFRLGEAAAHIEGMTQTMEDTMFYGDSASPEKFIGFTPRFASGNPAVAENAGQVINAGSVTADENFSIWMITWDPRICFGMFPRGSMAGLVRKDHGEVTVYDSNGGRFQAYREHFKWQLGLHLKDWRKVCRIANIDRDAITADSLDITKLLIKASHKIKRGPTGRTVIYCAPDVAASLDVKAQSQDNVSLGMREWAGEEILHFRNMPIRETDALVNTEPLVAFS